MSDFKLDPDEIRIILKFFPQGLVAFDFETTGLAPMVDRLLELAAIKVTRQGKVETYEQLVNPEVKIPAESMEIHNITDEMVENSPTIQAALPQFLSFLGDYPLVAHSAKYDASFLTFNVFAEHLPMGTNDVYCSCNMARSLLSEANSYKLTDLISYFELDVVNSHRALDDSKACLQVFARLLLTLEERELEASMHSRAFLFCLQDFRKKEVYEIPSHLELLQSTAKERLMIEIDYKGGTIKKGWRPVIPRLLIPAPSGMTLQAQCMLSGLNKIFVVKKIRSVRRVSQKEAQSLVSALENDKEVE